MGGSHAAHWLPALQVVAEEKGWRVVNITKGACLFTPAPQTAYDNSRPVERVFTPLSAAPVPEATVEERLAKEIRFDPDVWIVEIEDREGRHFLELAAK